jgi:pimeloyl-ACP methyl ester carboxylesterase
MPYAERAGCRLYYQIDASDLPVLVLIRGLGRSQSYWGPLVPLLAPHFRLLRLDNRGVGKSDATWRPYTTRQLADDVAHVMDAAGVDRAHVFGMSLGGMIALELVLAHGGRVDHLVLGCTTPGGPHAHRTEKDVQRIMLKAAIGRRPERLFDLLVSDASLRARPEIRAEWLELARTEPTTLHGYFGQLAAAARHDTFDRLSGITHPTLVLTGDDDRIIPMENSRLIAARIPNASLTVLPSARHDFTTDLPDAAASALLDFLHARPS